MDTMTIPNVDEQTRHRLRARAAEHGVSMEEEALLILRDVLSQDANEATAARDEQPKREWHLKVSLEELMRLSVKPDKPFDQKAASDELYSYLEEE